METKNLSSATHKCVLVIDNAQPTGIVANIASVLSMTLGCKVNNIVSHDVYDKQGEKHLGITQLPIPILGASQEKIKEILYFPVLYIVPFHMQSELQIQ